MAHDKNGTQIIHVELTPREDGGHNTSVKLDVCDDHHFLDMMTAILENWWEVNHKS